MNITQRLINTTIRFLEMVAIPPCHYDRCDIVTDGYHCQELPAIVTEPHERHLVVHVELFHPGHMKVNGHDVTGVHSNGRYAARVDTIAGEFHMSRSQLDAFAALMGFASAIDIAA